MKTVADVYAPVSGEVTQVNDSIEKDPAKINQSAEKDGWLFKVKVSEEKDMSISIFQNKFPF